MFYRDCIQNTDQSFELYHKYSNIFVAFNDLNIRREAFYDKLLTNLLALYDNLESFISEYDDFQATLKPWHSGAGDDFISRMICYTAAAGVGPMASVAGAIADSLLDKAEPHADMIIIENGGDIALTNIQESKVLVYPGAAGITGMIMIKLPPGRWGIASSSGKFGHSLSLGQADLVTAVAKNATEADSFATAIANRVTPGVDPRRLLTQYANLDAILIVRNGKLWYRGEFELSFD
jgi:ApbE superfamily uncharacterized protein (UPF0280 family)